MITPLLTTRSLILVAAVMLAADASAQLAADLKNDPAGANPLSEKTTGPHIPEEDQCSIDLHNPGQMKDIVSNVLMRSAKLPEAKVQAFLKDAQKYATGDALMRAAAKHFMIDETQMAEEVQRFKHINCTHGPRSDDPVRDLERAVQLADIQNDPAGAKALLEKLIRPEIPTKILEEANARLAKMNSAIELNIEPDVKAIEGAVDSKTGKVLVTKTDPPGMEKQVQTSASATERLEEAMNLLVSAGAKDRSALVDAAIDGMAKSMGRSGEFISAEEIRKSHITLNENTGGIGAVMGGDQRGVFIWNALPGSSAAKAGIEDESIVLEVDGKTPFALGGDVPAVITAMRGLVGTRVKLKLKSPSGEVREVELERERRGSYPAKCEQLNSSLLPADVLGIAIGGFDEGARTKVSAILDQEAFRAKLPRGLIIDLRGNSGGSLTEAMAIADFFLTQGVVVTHREEDGRIVSPHAVPDEMFAGVPIAVLVDEGTASSAEVLAAALQDHHRAAIIGRRTAGAGSVSEPHSLKGGGVIKRPVAWFVRPSGADLERHPHMTESDPWGVVPDIVVAAAPRKPLKPGQITKPKDEDQNLMIQAALAHFESLNAKE